nr:peptide chain release factor N(5)-glutamine methyltransferase [Chitinophagaceae bacterium]
MKISTARNTIMQACSALYDREELIAVCKRILEHLSGKSNLELLLDKDLEIEDEELLQIIESLQNNKPLQYVLGYEWFANLKLKVNQHVLIPRPETEELTQLVISYLKKKEESPLRLLDIGTGSGAIPILIKKEVPNVSMYALDINEHALEVASENAQYHQTAIQFIYGDILNKNLSLEQTFDVIISNPPYISTEEKETMHQRVLLNEPALALFVTNNDPLQFYKAILQFSQKHINKGGRLFLEINSLHGQSIKALFESRQYSCEIQKDMYQNDRFAIVKYLKE